MRRGRSLSLLLIRSIRFNHVTRLRSNHDVIIFDLCPLWADRVESDSDTGQVFLWAEPTPACSSLSENVLSCSAEATHTCVISNIDPIM